MTVREKSLLVQAVSLVLLLFATYWIIQKFLALRLAEEAARQVESDIRRLDRALARELSELDTICEDWASWDATCEFIESGSPDYVKENLVEGTFKTLRLDDVMFLQTNGQVVWARSYEESSPLLDALRVTSNPPACRLLCANKEDRCVGLLRADAKLLLISARPILTSEGKGPVRGTLIMGRLLTPEAIARLAAQMEVPAVLLPADTRVPPLHSVRREEQEQRIYVHQTPDDQYEGYLILQDFNGQGVGLLHRPPTSVLRETGAAVAYRHLLLLLVSGFFIGLTGFVLLDRVVLQRLTSLGHQLASIRKSNDLGARLKLEGRDEVTQLAEAINRLLAHFQTLQETIRASNLRLEETVLERTKALETSRLELRRLYDHIEQVRENERKKMALQVHDDIGQPLTAIQMAIERLAKRVDSAAPETEKILNELRGLTRNLLDTAQNIAMDWRPFILDHFGLPAALDWLAKRFGQQTGVLCEAEIAQTFPDQPALCESLFRIAQELLTNVTRHAQATKAAFRWIVKEDVWLLEVEDNGRGFSQADLMSPTAFGLRAVRERASFWGGTATYSTAPTGGAKVSIRIPRRLTSTTGNASTEGRRHDTTDIGSG